MAKFEQKYSNFHVQEHVFKNVWKMAVIFLFRPECDNTLYRYDVNVATMVFVWMIIFDSLWLDSI